MLKSIIGRFFGKEECIKPKSLKWEVIECKGKKLLANYFFNNWINYDYNVPVKGGFLKKTIGTCSFYLPRYDAYILYCCNKPECSKKTKKMVRKFKKKWLNFIPLYLEELNHLDDVLKTKLEKILWKEFVVVGT